MEMTVTYEEAITIFEARIEKKRKEIRDYNGPMNSDQD